MDAVLKTLAVYFFLMLMFRMNGKRSLGQITAFDFILLLIIGESVQQALIGKDFSMTNCFIVITVLMALDVGLSKLKLKYPALDSILESRPLVIVEHGEPIQERMQKERIDSDDVLEAARELHGLERLSQIKYAVLERNGSITIIPT